MGGFNPISTVLGTVGAVANITKPVRDTYGNYRDMTAAYQQAEKNYQENQRTIAEQNALEQQKIQLENEETDRRRLQLRRDQASRQAAFGGQGIDTTDGSGEAVMLGLLQQSEAEKSYQDRLTEMKQQARQQDTDAKNRRNMLNLQNNYRTARDGIISNFDTLL